MSKALRDALGKMKSTKNAVTKFSPAATEDNRIIPSRTKDAKYQVWIDAGNTIPRRKSLMLLCKSILRQKVLDLRISSKKILHTENLLHVNSILRLQTNKKNLREFWISWRRRQERSFDNK